MATGPTVVTGASGFVGRHLSQRLAAAGVAPLVTWGHSRPAFAGGASRTVNVLDRHAVQTAIEQDSPSHLFHLAGAPHVGSAWRNALPTLEINVLGTHHLLEAVRTGAPHCRVLIVTSGMVYRPGPDRLTEDAPLAPNNPYGLSKLAQDQLARLVAAQDHLHVVVARPFNHIGPGQAETFAISSFARQIALIERGVQAPTMRVGNLDAERDLTDVRDVVDAYRRILDRGTPGAAYNVCSGRTWRIGDLLDHLLTRATVAITVTPDPELLRPADSPRLVGSADRLVTELGWQPAIPMEQTLFDTLAWWRAELGPR